MAQLLSYSVSSAIFLIPLYLVFKWMMAGENQPRLNRAILLSVYFIAIIAPFLCRLPWQSLLGLSGSTPVLTDVTIGLPVVVAVIPDLTQPSPIWRILLITYILGIAITSILSLSTLFSLVRVIRRSYPVSSDGRFSVRLLPDSSRVAPFSWIRYIIMPRSDYSDPAIARLIVLHEVCHLRRRHWLDLLLAQLVCIVQWFNPAAWLMRDELRSIHEFQADADVISSLRGNISDYQYLLIKKAVGARFPSLANSLNHSNLKKRITMMYKSNPSASRRFLRATAVAPAIAGAAMLLNVPAVSAAISSIADTSLSSQREVSEISTDVQTPVLYLSETIENADPSPILTVTESTAPTDGDKKDEVMKAAQVMPQFPGGESEMMLWLSQNIVYPKPAIEKDIQGKVIVRFVVDKSGKVSDPTVIRKVDPLLDAEALRVVSQLPDFIPGMTDGKPVSVWYTLPVSFKLWGKPSEVKSDSVLRYEDAVNYTPEPRKSDVDNSITIVGNPPADDNGIKVVAYAAVAKTSSDENTEENEIDPHYIPSEAPVIFIDDKISTDDQLKALPPSEIKSIAIDKNSSQFPNGVVRIVTKKASK